FGAERVTALNKEVAIARRLLALLIQFQESAEFQFKISPRTRRDYIKQIKRIEKALGDFPIKALDDPRATSIFLEWRDRLAQSSLRQADYAYATLSRILSLALGRRKIKTNPCQWRQAICGHPRRQDLERCRRGSLPAHCASVSATGDAARDQHRATPRRSPAFAVVGL